jgi:hypothetical protein
VNLFSRRLNPQKQTHAINHGKLNMNYTQTKAFRDANENLIFHTTDPTERWCFARAHMIYAGTGINTIEFQFPLYVVRVGVDSDAVAELEEILQGRKSLITLVANLGNEDSFLLAKSITVESAYPELEAHK